MLKIVQITQNFIIDVPFSFGVDFGISYFVITDDTLYAQSQWKP